MSESRKIPPFFAVSGPSGSGKTSICRKMAAEFGLYYSVSHTSRPQRENEVNGKDYFFVTRQEFENLQSQGEFLEWAQVYDNLYGTSKRIIEEKLGQGQGVIVDVDTQGADSIRNLMPHVVLIFIRTPHLEDLTERLKIRGRDSLDEIAKRMKNAESELSHIKEYDHVVVNDDFDRAASEVKAIIQKTLQQA